MKSLFLSAVCLFLHFLSYSQKDCNQWVFGNQLGLDFNSNPPTVTTNTNLNSMECSAAIADWNGNLLFYTEGSTIWDKNHGVMANGTNLGGGWSAANGAVIVKQPGNANLYYLFNTGQTPAGNFSYSIVDMSLAGGLGAVTVSAATVFSPVLEGVCGVRHCNGTDVWIIVQEKNSSNLKAYLLTASGLSLTPVTSSVGVSFSTVLSITKAAPGGKKLINSQNQGDFTLFDFDNTTGIISNSLSLSFPTQSPLNTTFGYGCDFSPDGSKVYGCVYGFTLSGQTAVPGLFQWDICAGSNAAIIASRTNINPGTDHRSILRATNGKMYSTSSASNTVLNVVGSPNLLGTSSNFTAGAFSVPTGTTTYGLPNFVNDIKEPLVSFAYTTTPSLGCQTASFNSPYAAGTGFGCSSSGYTIGNVTWNFGDPLSGSSNTSNLQNPSHAFTNLGTYTVQQILHYTCGVRNDTLREVVQIVDPCITINASVSCASLGSATAQTSTGPGSFTYTWLPTNQTGSVATGLVP
ncbi:MAG: PKD domain-containing protein, partial [Bacteroidia bacterium]|nr:PKD domain-containing protein [Bacteroidia bacterium]